MKKTLFFVVIVVFSLSSYAQYPGQTSDGKREVPDLVTYMDQKPVIFHIGNVKWIHDPRNKSLILFKGADADSILNEILSWIERKTDDSGFLVTPVVRITGTTIDPFTLFTRKELREQDNKRRVVELTKFRTYVVTMTKFTYAEDFEEWEYVKYSGKKPVYQTPVTGNNVQQKEPQQEEKLKPKKQSAFHPRTRQ